MAFTQFIQPVYASVLSSFSQSDTKHGRRVLVTRRYHVQNVRPEVALKGSSLRHSESLSHPQRGVDSELSTSDTGYATQAFLTLFHKAFRKKDSAACLQLVRSLMAAINKTEGRADRKHEGCEESPEDVQRECDSQDTDVVALESWSEPSPTAVLPFSSESQEYLGQILRGKHQGLMRLLLAAGNLEGALDYLAMLPPSSTLCSTLMKECIDANDLAGLHRVLQVRINH